MPVWKYKMPNYVIRPVTLIFHQSIIGWLSLYHWDERLSLFLCFGLRLFINTINLLNISDKINVSKAQSFFHTFYVGSGLVLILVCWRNSILKYNFNLFYSFATLVLQINNINFDIACVVSYIDWDHIL